MTYTDKKRDLYIYNNFDSGLKQTVEDLWDILKEDKEKLDKEKKPKLLPIRLHISSYGGHVPYLHSVMTAMDAQIAPVITLVEGAAYSCGSLLSVYGDYRIAGKSARFLIHPPAALAMGEASYLESSAEELRKIDKWGIEHYAKYTDIEKEELEHAFSTHRQWYISAQEALELGMIDEIIEKRPIEFSKKKKSFTVQRGEESYSISI